MNTTVTQAAMGRFLDVLLADCARALNEERALVIKVIAAIDERNKARRLHAALDVAEAGHPFIYHTGRLGLLYRLAEEWGDVTQCHRLAALRRETFAFQCGVRMTCLELQFPVLYDPWPDPPALVEEAA